MAKHWQEPLPGPQSSCFRKASGGTEGQGLDRDWGSRGLSILVVLDFVTNYSRQGSARQQSFITTADSFSSGLARQLLLEVSQHNPTALEQAPPNPPESLGEMQTFGGPLLLCKPSARWLQDHEFSHWIQIHRDLDLSQNSLASHCCFRLLVTSKPLRPACSGGGNQTLLLGGRQAGGCADLF